MTIIIGRDARGNSVQFHHDAQPVEADAALMAENAVVNGATGATPTHASQTITGTLAVNGVATLAQLPINAVTAYHTAQTQAGAAAHAALATGQINVITCANAGDVIALPAAVKGNWCIIDMSGAAQNAAIFSLESSTTTLDGSNVHSASVTFTQTHRIAILWCSAAGAWTSALLGAVIS